VQQADRSRPPAAPGPAPPSVAAPACGAMVPCALRPSASLARVLAESRAPGLQPGESVPVGCTVAPKLAQDVTRPVASRVEGAFSSRRVRRAGDLRSGTPVPLVTWLAHLLERAVDAQTLETTPEARSLARLCQPAFPGRPDPVGGSRGIACIELLAQVVTRAAVRDPLCDGGLKRSQSGSSMNAAGSAGALRINPASPCNHA